jgi:hypothetical protein
MTTHHTYLNNNKTNPAPNGVFKQELVTLDANTRRHPNNPPQAAFLWWLRQ